MFDLTERVFVFDIPVFRHTLRFLNIKSETKGKELLLLNLLFYIFNSDLRPFQDYFSSYETGQSVGGRKRESPEKNSWHIRKQNLACLTCGQSGAPTHTRHSSEMIE